MLKLDNNGNVSWQKTYGGSDQDEAYSIQQTTEGGYIVAGNTRSFGAGNYDFWVLKLVSNGNVGPSFPGTWQKTYGGIDYDSAHSIQQTIDGGFIVTGYDGAAAGVNGRFYVMETDSNGDIPDCNIISTTNPIVSDLTMEVNDTEDIDCLLR